MVKAVALALASFFGFFGAGHPPATTVTHAAVITWPSPYPTCPPLPRAPFPYAKTLGANAKHGNVLLPPVHVCPL